MSRLVRDNVADLKLYVPGKPMEEVQRELGIQDIHKLASNENPLGPSPKALEAMAAYLKQVNIYPDGNGFYLKQALAQHLWVNTEQITLGAGSDEIVQFLALAFINPGDEVICAHPSFPRYEPTTKLMNGICHEVPLKEHRHDLEAMAALINEKTKIIYICNPNNPTGTIMTKNEVDRFMDKVPESVLVIFDEAYFEYVTHEEYPNGLDYLAQGRQVIILRTFSKVYGLAGLRIGYGISTPEIISYLNRVRPPFNSNAIAQVAALAALQDQPYLAEVTATNQKGKEYLYGEFQAMGLDYIPSETNFIMVDTGHNSGEVFKKLLSKGIIIRSGDIFGMETWIRVTIGTLEQNRLFIEALKQIIS